VRHSEQIAEELHIILRTIFLNLLINHFFIIQWKYLLCTSNLIIN